MSKVLGLVSFQPTGAKVRKEKRMRQLENKVVRMQKNNSRYSDLIGRAEKAQSMGYTSHAEKLRDMAKQFC